MVVVEGPDVSKASEHEMFDLLLQDLPLPLPLLFIVHDGVAELLLHRLDIVPNVSTVVVIFIVCYP